MWPGREVSSAEPGAELGPRCDRPSLAQMEISVPFYADEEPCVQTAQPNALAYCRKAGYKLELAWTCCDYADTLFQRNEPGNREGRRSAEYIQKEFGVDIAERERLQLKPEMIEEADRVIVIDEKESWPDYLQEGGKVEFWDIGEPLGRDDAFVLKVFGQVRQRGEELAKELG